MNIRSLTLLFITNIVISTAGIAQSIDLEKAYNANSVKLLKSYMDSWSSDIKAISTAELERMPGEVAQAYHLFETFYNPHSLAQLGASKWYSELYKQYTYYVIQNSINIYQVDRIYKTDADVREYIINQMKKTYKDDGQKQKAIENVNKANMNHSVYVENLSPNYPGVTDSSRRLISTIKNFRPRILQVQASPLYLDSLHNKAINDFLGNDHEPFGQPNVMSIARAAGKSLKKQEFLQKIIKINHNHWGNGWELNTPPYVTITFDKDFTSAKIDYGLVYEGGHAIYEFKNGSWELLSTKRTWRE